MLGLFKQLGKINFLMFPLFSGAVSGISCLKREASGLHSFIITKLD